MNLISDNKFIILPCSGIGKAFGTIGREATYIITEDLRPYCTETLCLSLLTMHDNESKNKIRTNSTITIDGCPKMCAKVNVEKNGGKLVESFTVFDTYRENKNLKTKAISTIEENGYKLARILADKIVIKIDELTSNMEEN